MTLYMLYGNFTPFDDYDDSLGLIGIYDSKSEAEQVASAIRKGYQMETCYPERNPGTCSVQTLIEEVELNKTYCPEITEFGIIPIFALDNREVSIHGAWLRNGNLVFERRTDGV